MAKLLIAVDKRKGQAIIVAKLRWRGPDLQSPASSGKGLADGDGQP